MKKYEKLAEADKKRYEIQKEEWDRTGRFKVDDKENAEDIVHDIKDKENDDNDAKDNQYQKSED